jgi:serine/threonine-protein kinase
MATIRLGMICGDAGFSRVVAVKHLHEHIARDPDFAAMLLDEARLASRIRHPNVVTILDVVREQDQLYLIMEYIYGEALSGLLRAARADQQALPPAVAVAIACDALAGLAAAHRAVDAHGAPLGIVHRDVTPHNILVGADGSARVLDFGVAKAVAKLHTTRDGTLKGTLPYMAPENLRGEAATVQSDLHAVGSVLWEALTGERLFRGDNEAVILGRVLEGVRRPPSALAANVPPALDAVVLCALQRNPRDRYESALEMQQALQQALAPAPPPEVGVWVERLAGAVLAARREHVASVERGEAWKDAQPPRGHGVTRTALPAPVADAPAQTTTVALSTHNIPTVRRASSRRWLLLAASVCVLGALYATVAERAPAAVARSAALARAAALAVTAAPPELPPATSATATPVPDAQIRASASARPPPPRPATRRVAPTKAAAPDCNPPAVRDDAGILRVKPGCDRTGAQ